jgi:diadenosine tetraphosphate (Ap4A) HIT family hydrolase
VETLVHERVEEARKGANPAVVTRLDSGWVVLGDKQVVRGYCILLPDPVVSHLNELSYEDRVQFLGDMTLIGDALLKVTGAVRINYEILGNWEPALHGHVFPRYDTEPDSVRRAPVWLHDWDNATPFSPTRDKRLIEELAKELEAAKAQR